jgi:cyclic pyranopterin phosphate synthase
MQDALGRTIRYLRLSLTHACAMRCIYCRPEGYATHRDSNELNPNEIEQLITHLATEHGLRKVRLTGGEPTSRPDLIEIVRRVAAVPGIKDLAMTTNGLTLARQAKDLKSVGLKRVNISIDSLIPARFASITGVDGLTRILAGIEAARSAGLWPVRLNTVVVRGQNEDELPALLEFAAEKDLEIRFIELMPMGPLHEKWSERYVPESDMREILSRAVDVWQPLPTGSDSARRYHAALTSGRQAVVGFITAMSHNFCDQCDRVRIGANGELYPCLMDAPAGNILAAMRPRFDPDLLDEILRNGLTKKAPEHPVRGHAVMIELGG